MERCRTLCTDALASIDSDMQHIRDRASDLWALEGPVSLTLVITFNLTDAVDYEITSLLHLAC